MIKIKHHNFLHAHVCARCVTSGYNYIIIANNEEHGKNLKIKDHRFTMVKKKLTLKNINITKTNINLRSLFKHSKRSNYIEIILCKCGSCAWVINDDIAIFDYIHKNTKLFLDFQFEHIFAI